MTTLAFVAGMLLGGKAGLFLALYLRGMDSTGADWADAPARCDPPGPCWQLLLWTREGLSLSLGLNTSVYTPAQDFLRSH
jgi:hypothetical protein